MKTLARQFRIFTALVFLAFGPACARSNYAPPGSGITSKAGANGCTAEFTNSRTCVRMQWEVMPTETTFGSFVFTATDANTALLVDLTATQAELPKVVLWMPSMGHGSSPVKVERLGLGVYRATKVFFNMKGDWEIRFQTADDKATYALDI